MTAPEAPEVRERWRLALDEHLNRKARIAALRRDLAAARSAGVAARHQAKIRRGRRAGDPTSKETK